MEEVFDVITGMSYGLMHLAARVHPFYLLLDGEQITVHLHVFYSNHCYTRSRTKDDPSDAVLFVEPKRDGMTDERVFCPARYAFSHHLPQLMAGLNQALCYRGSDGHMFYRLKSDPNARRGTHGWYICGRLDASAKRHELRLNIRSVHYRTNEPSGVRGTCRFFQILLPFYLAQKAKYCWL